MLSLGAISAVVLLLIGIFGQAPSPVASAASSTTRTPVPTVPTTTTTPPPTTTTPTPTTPTTQPIPDTAVIVLNSTDVRGLAARVTEYLGGLGWNVVTPDNYAPTLEQTTVFYPEGLEPQARRLVQDSPGADLVEPAPAILDQTMLTLVLGNDVTDFVLPTG